ncbi:MAG TPA: hypothetical protein DCY20_03290 [Firmicutes bacterium]|nr:hypothetical protein [Bacillota bacterium]
MIRGLYTAASGMLVENRKLENISQNISNIGTAGFKQTYLSTISQEESTLKTGNLKESIGTITMKVGIDESLIHLTQGELQTSNQPYDFAIEGDGFFTLEGPGGERLYTRDGRFGVDDQGRLVSKEGFPVLVSTDKGIGYASVNDQEFVTSETGSFTVNGETYQFLISDLQNQNQIVRYENNLFGYNGGNAPINYENVSVYQGMIEGSNVDATDEMVNLISTSRSFQMNSKVLQVMDQVLEQSVNELGKV